MFIMWKVFNGYRSQPVSIKKLTLDEHLFTLLMLYFSANIAFFFADLLRFHIPLTGLITSWCASYPPNRGLVIFVIIADYLNYCILVLPFLVSLLRMIILRFSYNYKRIRSLAIKWIVLPILFFVPLLCVSYLFQSLGYCRRFDEPFPFGAIDIYSTRGAFGLRRSYFILGLSFTCWSLCAVLSGYMYIKLRTSPLHNASTFTKKLARRAELSVSITLISAIVPFITNTVVSVTTIWKQDIMFYLIFLRIFGNDFETVMMPWVLYFTHPIFREKPAKSNIVAVKSISTQKVLHSTSI
uniref:G_PROTEIN_RECEP_F1_2 domain-containing protein n=1 Tax=Caenorhabditis tropicalis TaxID=1561998 RepID=A0A1I7T7L7_9PELO